MKGYINLQAFDFFDKIYCINPPSYSDRRAKVSVDFRAGEIIDRIEWVNTPIPNDFPWQKHYKTKGEVGCTLSHINAIKKAYDDGAENVLIFEDDVQFMGSILKRLPLAIKELPDDWDFFYLGGSPCDKLEPIGEHISKIPGRFLCAHSYCVRRRSMMPFYEFAKKAMYGEWPSTMNDNSTFNFLMGTDANGYTIDPYVCRQRPGHSIIHNGRFTDYSEMLHRNWVEHGRAK